jgi:hypothetical protein
MKAASSLRAGAGQQQQRSACGPVRRWRSSPLRSVVARGFIDTLLKPLTTAGKVSPAIGAAGALPAPAEVCCPHPGISWCAVAPAD